MSSPQSFMTVPAPNLQQQVPQINFAGALNQFNQQRQLNAFASGIPMLDAQGNPTTDPKAPGAHPDYQSIISKTFQAGGSPAVQGLMPYLIYMGALNKPKSYEHLATGGADTQPPPSQTEAAPANPAGAGVGNIAPSQSAAAAGELPPGEGSQERPYQINSRADYDKIESGSWYAVKGLKPQIKGQEGKAPSLTKANAPESAQQATAPENAAAGQAVSSGAATPEERLATYGQRQLAEGNVIGEGGITKVSSARQPKVAGKPGPVATPPTGEQTERTARAAPQAQTQQPQQPQEPPYQPPVRPPLPPHDASAGDAKIADMQARQNRLSADIAEWGSTNGPLKINQGAIEAATQKINNLQKDIDARREALNKPFEEENKAKAAGFPNAASYDTYKKAQEKANDAGQRQIEQINSGATQMALELEPHIANGKALLNSGNIYTGFGAETAMEFNRAKQIWGDRIAATPQEAFKKTVAAAQLAQANLQRVMAGIGGAQGGASRLFAAQINLVGESSASLGNTVAGNRFLMENAERSMKQFYAIQKLASDYIAAGHPFLDQAFDQKVVDYVRKNPLLKNDLERADPAKFLSAPQVPAAVAKAAEKDPSALPKWQRMVGAKPGDPIRNANGDGYFKALTLKVPRRGENTPPEQVPQQVPGR